MRQYPCFSPANRILKSLSLCKRRRSRLPPLGGFSTFSMPIYIHTEQKRNAYKRHIRFWRRGKQIVCLHAKQRAKMPKSCCVTFCTTNKAKNPELKCIRLPSVKTEPTRRTKWLQAIRREDTFDNLIIIIIIIIR